jgi:hypothetical protein
MTSDKYKILLEKGKYLRYNLFFYESINVFTEAMETCPDEWVILQKFN